MKLDHKQRDHQHEPSSANKDHDHRADKKDDHVPRAAEAGVETDTRWGDEEEAFDITGSVMRVEATRGGARITIARGRADGVHVGMEGYLRGGGTDGMLADFSIDSVEKRWCIATVDVRPEDLQHVTAIINPAQPIARVTAAGERNATILRVTVSGSHSRIVISGGRDEGYSYGTPGYVAGADGQPLAHFELEQVDSRSCVAMVALAPDALQRNPRVVLGSKR